MEMSFNITKSNPELPSRGIVEVCVLVKSYYRPILLLRNSSMLLGIMREIIRWFVVTKLRRE